MKILFVINKLNIGGPQKVAAFLANKLVEDKHDVYILAYSKSETNIYIDNRVSIINIGYEAEKKNRLSYIVKRFNQIPLLFKIRNHIKTINPDIVCVFTISVLRMVKTALLGLNFNIVSSERGNPFIYSQSFRYKAKKIYSKCKLVVFQTKKAMDLFELGNARVIPNPAVLRNTTKDSIESGLHNLILAAGRLEEEKGFDMLISCIKDVSESVDCHLRIYGTGSLESTLRQQIEKYGLNDKVELPGDDCRFFEKNSDAVLYVLSSFTEGMPNVLIEAMMYGIPCLATDCSSGGPRFLLEDGNGGYLVEVANKEQMTEMIKYILTHKNEAFEKAKQAKSILKLLEPDRIYKMWLEAFQSVLCKKED